MKVGGNILWLFCAILTYNTVSGQNLAKNAVRFPNIGTLLNGLPFVRPNVGVIGDPYFNLNWGHGKIQLENYDVPTDEYWVRYNIQLDELEVKSSFGIRAMSCRMVTSMSFTDSLGTMTTKFVSGKNYHVDNVPLKGLLELLADGPLQLVRRYYIFEKAPDYNPALNSGSQDVTLIKKYDLFIAKEGALSEVKSKKKLMPHFGEKASEMESFIKARALSVSSPADLTEIITHYNSLVGN
ncbi:MAG: hypothetical protein K2U26_06805 [Cyclobacteriaceae bacterium]|nr:hypothetical protein [Cyclobacteriaceae bacterium]